MPNKPLTPNCCKEVKKTVAVSLRLPFDYWYLQQADLAPEWVILTYDGEYGVHKQVEAKFCPHCGAAVPKIKPRAKPLKRVYRMDETGDYCLTCGERNSYCKCWAPEYAWECEK